MELPQATYGPWSRCAVSLLVRWRTGVPRETYTATTIQSALAAVHDAGIFKSETTVRHQENKVPTANIVEVLLFEARSFPRRCESARDSGLRLWTSSSLPEVQKWSAKMSLAPI